jgi:hypothetical protein
MGARRLNLRPAGFEGCRYSADVRDNAAPGGRRVGKSATGDLAEVSKAAETLELAAPAQAAWD